MIKKNKMKEMKKKMNKKKEKKVKKTKKMRGMGGGLNIRPGEPTSPQELERRLHSSLNV